MVEALDKPGGRAYVRNQDGFVFDMGQQYGVPHFIGCSVERDQPWLDETDSQSYRKQNTPQNFNS